MVKDLAMVFERDFEGHELLGPVVKPKIISI